MAVETKTHTAQDVITYMERQFGDESQVQITTADIIRWINMGQREIFENNTTVNQVFTSADIVANQNTYSLASLFPNIRTIRSVRFNQGVLNPVSRQQAEMYILYNNAMYPPPPAGIPTDWWLDDAGILYLFPTPLNAVSGGLNIHYTAYPNSIVGTSDTLDIPDSYYHVLLNYVMAQVYELDENWQAAQAKRNDWKESMAILANRTEVEEDHFPVIILDPEDSTY